MQKLTLLTTFCLAGLLLFGCSDDEDSPTDTGTDTSVADSGDDGATDSDMANDSDDDALMLVPLGRDNPPTTGTQIDRAGRPAITAAGVGTFMPDGDPRDDLKDDYNGNTDRSTWVGTYRDGIADMIAILDGADTVCGNQLGYDASGGVATAYDFLAGVLADDRLIIDSDSGTCPEYLGYEAEVLGVVEEGGCGGRTPNQDVIDRSYSVLINGSLGDLGDAVDADNETHDENVFPFLAAP